MRQDEFRPERYVLGYVSSDGQPGSQIAISYIIIDVAHSLAIRTSREAKANDARQKTVPLTKMHKEYSLATRVLDALHTHVDNESQTKLLLQVYLQAETFCISVFIAPTMRLTMMVTTRKNTQSTDFGGREVGI